MSSSDDDAPLAGARRYFPTVGAGARVLATPPSTGKKAGGPTPAPAPPGVGAGVAAAAAAAAPAARTPPPPSPDGSPVPDWIKSVTPKKRLPTPTPSPSSDSDDDAPLAAVLGKDVDKAPAAVKEEEAKSKPPSAAKAAKKAAAAKAAAPGVEAAAAPAAAAAGAAPPVRTGPANRTSDLPLLLPDRLLTNRFICEAEEAADGGRADLAGDAGVVGRVSAGPAPQGAPPGAPRVARLDLKGRLYRISTLPCTTTLLYVAVGPAEARVEALSTSYLRLDAEAGPDGAGGDGESSGEAGAAAGRGVFDDDGGDEWAPEGGWGAAGGADAQPKKKGGGGKAKAGGGGGGGGGGGAGAKKKNPYAGGGGGVAKKPARAKARGGAKKGVRARK